MILPRRYFLAFGVAAVLAMMASVIVAEGSLRVARPAEPSSTADALARSTSSSWRSAEIRARDGTSLRAWRFKPAKSNGSAVIALHGVADCRRGVLTHARMLVENGYTVLAPDSRGHGESVPALLSYGLKEADDLRLWLDWLLVNERPHSVFALGESMGASILLQTLATERRFRAVAAEAIQNSSTPILLIHGRADRNISPNHSLRLAAANPRIVTLWQPEGAGHTGAIGAYPEEFRDRVLSFFAAR